MEAREVVLDMTWYIHLLRTTLTRYYIRGTASVRSRMIHSPSFGKIRSCDFSIVHLRLLIKVPRRANLINRLRRVRPHIRRVGSGVRIHIRPAAIGLAGRLHDTSRDDGAERLQAIIFGGHGHVVVVKDHGAAAAAVGVGPVVDIPALGGNQGAELRRGGRAVGLGGLDGAAVDPYLGVGAALDGFDLAVEQGR